MNLLKRLLSSFIFNIPLSVALAFYVGFLISLVQDCKVRAHHCIDLNGLVPYFFAFVTLLMAGFIGTIVATFLENRYRLLCYLSFGVTTLLFLYPMWAVKSHRLAKHFVESGHFKSFGILGPVLTKKAISSLLRESVEKADPQALAALIPFYLQGPIEPLFYAYGFGSRWVEGRSDRYSFITILLENGLNLRRYLAESKRSYLSFNQDGAKAFVDYAKQHKLASREGDHQGTTDLMLAAYEKRYEDVQKILEKGANPSQLSTYQYSAITWAILHRDQKMLDLLLTKVSKIEPVDLLRLKATRWYHRFPQFLDLVQYSEEERTLFYYDTLRDAKTLEEVKILLSQGADPHFHPKTYGMTHFNELIDKRNEDRATAEDEKILRYYSSLKNH